MRKHIGWMIVLSTLFSLTAAYGQNPGASAGSSEINGRAWLGVGLEDVPAGLQAKQTRGALVVEVTPDGPAANAGILPGDLILAIQGRVITDAHKAVEAIQELSPESRVAVRLLRNGRPMDLIVILGMMPNDTAQNHEEKADDRKKLFNDIVATLSGSSASQVARATVERVRPDNQAAGESSNPRHAQDYSKMSAPARAAAVNLHRLNPRYGDFDIAVPAGWEFQQGQEENPIIVGRGGPAGPSLTIWMWIRVTAVAENMTAADVIGDANWSLNACGPLEKAVSIHSTQWSPSQSAKLMVAYLRANGEPQARLISEHGIARNRGEARIASEVQGTPLESSIIISMDYYQDPGYAQQIALMRLQCPGIPALPAWESFASVVSCRAPRGTLADWQPVCAAILKSFRPRENWLLAYAQQVVEEMRRSGAEVGDIVDAITAAGRSRVQSMQDYMDRSETWGLRRADAHGYQGQPVDETGAPLPYKISGEFRYNCIEKDGRHRGTNDPYDKDCISITRVQ